MTLSQTLRGWGVGVRVGKELRGPGDLESKGWTKGLEHIGRGNRGRSSSTPEV